MHQRLKINSDRCRRTEGERATCCLLQAWRCDVRLQLCYISISEYVREIQNMGGIQRYPVFTGPVSAVVALSRSV